MIDCHHIRITKSNVISVCDVGCPEHVVLLTVVSSDIGRELRNPQESNLTPFKVVSFVPLYGTYNRLHRCVVLYCKITEILSLEKLKIQNSKILQKSSLSYKTWDDAHY